MKQREPSLRLRLNNPSEVPGRGASETSEDTQKVYKCQTWKMPPLFYTCLKLTDISSVLHLKTFSTFQWLQSKCMYFFGEWINELIKLDIAKGRNVFQPPVIKN